MERIENTQAKVATESDLSEFVGPEVMVSQNPSLIPRNMNDLVEADELDWTQRLFSYEEMIGSPNGIAIGPTDPPRYGSFHVFEFFQKIEVLRVATQKYFAASWDSIDVRVTLSDPKNLVGGLFVGWWPYIDWYDKNSSETMDVIFGTTVDDNLLMQGFLNGPYVDTMLFGMSKDLAINIPWTFKTPLIFTDILRNYDESNFGLRVPYGTPVVWWNMMRLSAYVSSVTNPARLRFFVKFNNLKFFGPSNYSAFSQSGLEGVAIAEVATAIAASSGVTAVTDAVTNLFVPKEEISETAEYGTFDRPQAVQLAYLGDTTSCDFAPTTAIFTPSLDMAAPEIPSVHDFLSRPQYLFASNTDNPPSVVSNNPMCFIQGTDSLTMGNWFRFFGMLNRYWRGTINVHVIVAGHPMVEVEFTSRTTYNGYNGLLSPTNASANIQTHRTVFPSSKSFLIPLPFCHMSDYLPIYDLYPSEGPPADIYLWSSNVEISLRIVSTMLDVAPVIPYYIFVSAGPDFAFYQPCPPGLYRPVLGDFARKSVKSRTGPVNQTGQTGKEKEPDAVSQVGLPLGDQVETVETRFRITSDPGTMVTLDTLEDYMKIWSRAMSFADYDNSGDQEPILDASVGFSTACWYPPIDRTADLDSNNSWYFTLDYIAYFSSLFMYYKGEMAFKVVTIKEIHEADEYIYVALSDPKIANQDIRQWTHVPYTYNEHQLPPECNFGTGCVVTPISDQPVLDFSLPYRGENVWSYSIYNAALRGANLIYGPHTNAQVEHNIVLQQTGVLADAVFRKIGPNFALAVEAGMPPPTMWVARGFDWSG